MKIYFLGHPIDMANRAIASFLESKGVELIYDIQSQKAIPWTDRWIVHTMNKLLHNTRIWRHPSAFKETILCRENYATRVAMDKIRAARPDAVLHVSGRRLWGREMKSVAAQTPFFLWMLEPLDYLQGILQTAPYYRDIFVYGSDWQKVLDVFGFKSSLLLHGYDSALFRPIPEAMPPIFDWCFVGRHTSYRAKCLEVLSEQFSSGALYGPGWREKLPSGSRLLQCWKGRGCFGGELNALYQSSRVTVDLCQDYHRPGAGLTLRLAETLGSGRKVLADAHKDHGLLGDTNGRLFVFQACEQISAAMRQALSAHAPRGVFDLPFERQAEELFESVASGL